MAVTKGLNFKVSASVAGQAAITSFTRAVSGIASVGTLAKNSMLGFSSEMNKQQRSYDALSALSKSYAVSLADVDRAYRLNAASGDEWSAATERLEAQFASAREQFAESPAAAESFLNKFRIELEQLTAKFNPAAAASQRYDASIMELNRALALGVINQNQYSQGLQKLSGSLAGVIAHNERLGLSMKSVADSASVFETEFARLQARFNPTAAAVVRFEQDVKELSRALNMGVIGNEEYQAELFRLKNALNAVTSAEQRTTTATNTLGVAIDRHNRVVGSWNRGMSNTGRAIQQTGFQVSDFFIQVAGGQSVIVAFIQQAGQIIQFFGVWGSVIAAVVTVLGGLWLMFRKGKDAVKSADSALGDLNSALGDFRSAAQIAKTDVAELKEQYGQWADEIKRVAGESMRFSSARAFDAVKAGAIDATTGLSAVFNAQKEVVRLNNELQFKQKLGVSSFADVELLRDQVDLTQGLAGAMGLSVAEAQRLYLAIGEFNGSDSMLGMRDSSAEVLRLLGEMYPATSKIPPEISKMQAEYLAANQQLTLNLALTDQSLVGTSQAAAAATTLASQLQGVGQWALIAANHVKGIEPPLSAAEAAARRLAAVDMASGIWKAVTAADGLVGRLVTAFNAARAVASLETRRMEGIFANMRGRAGAPGQGERSYSLESWNRLNSFNTEGTGSTGSSGGESPIQRMQKEYADLVKALDPAVLKSNDFAKANEAIQAAFATGNTALITTTFAKVKTDIEAATEAVKEFKSVADSLSSTFLTAFKGIVTGTKSVKDGVMDMLNAVIDRTLDLLMAPVFDGIASFITKGIFGFSDMMPELPSFAGGGHTGNKSRSGGLDGKGGFLAVMHPKESVTDHTMARSGSGSGSGGSSPVTVNVYVDGATGNSEVMQMVQRGVSTGLEYYDRQVLPQSMRRVSANPRRNG